MLPIEVLKSVPEQLSTAATFEGLTDRRRIVGWTRQRLHVRFEAVVGTSSRSIPRVRSLTGIQSGICWRLSSVS